MEQDFGFYEGKPVFARPQKGGTISGKEAHRALHKDDPGFVDIESKEAMALRADAFLDENLLPIMEEDKVIAVVSHGIILSALWRRFLQRLPPKSVTTHPEVIAMHGQLDLERLGGWSNTGYLELEMRLAPSVTIAPSPASLPEQEIVPLVTSAVDSPTVKLSLPKHEASQEMVSSPASRSTTSTRIFASWRTTVRAVNHKAHLANLKRTRGGVGSSRHDEKQKCINSFFKKQKKE